MPSPPLNPGLLRVQDTHGSPVGAGFLIDDRHAVTCAHVVAQALGLHRDHDRVPDDAEIRVDLPLLAPGRALRARVVFWLPVDENERGDVAGLELLDPLPAGARAPRLLAPAKEVWGHGIRAFGFPARHDMGVWTSGRLLGNQAAGWLQTENDHDHGFRIEPGFSGGPVWDEDLSGVIGMAVAAEAGSGPRVGYLIPTTTLAAAWDRIRAATARPCPFRGLSSFRERDADVFHGREDPADEIARLAATQRTVTLVGPSGCGKSSLVHAGALPRLRRTPDTLVVSFRPTDTEDAVQSLAAALIGLVAPDLDEVTRLGRVPELARVLRQGGLAATVGRLLERHDARRLVVIADQMEESLTQKEHGATASLVAILTDPALPARSATAVIVVRTDLLDKVLGDGDLATRLRRTLIAVGAMDRAELTRAVTGPLATTPGVEPEPGLVQRILDDLGSEAGRLPLLEFTLTQLWEKQAEQHTGLLTHTDYDELGGVVGALARHAQTVWDDTGANEDQGRRLLLRMVHLSPTGQATRRPVPRSELTDEAWEIVTRMADARLVAVRHRHDTGDSAELVHEALITRWDLLRGWIREDHEFRLWQQSLTEAMSRGPGGDTLRAHALATATDWATRRPDDLTADEHAFIRAARRVRTRRRRLRRIALAVTAAVTTTALLLGALYLQSRAESDRRRAEADSRRLADASRAYADTAPDVAALLAISAYRIAPTVEARSNLLRLRVLTEGLDSVMSDSADEGLSDASWSADATVWLTRVDTADTTVVTLRHQERGRVREQRLDTDFRVTASTVSADGRTLALAGPGHLALYDARTGRPSRALPPMPGAGPTSLTLAPNGQALAVVADNTRLSAFDLRPTSPARRLTDVPVAGNTQASFDADGNSLMIATPDPKNWSSKPLQVNQWFLADGRTRPVPDQFVVKVGATGRFAALCRPETFWQASDYPSIVRIVLLPGFETVREQRLTTGCDRDMTLTADAGHLVTDKTVVDLRTGRIAPYNVNLRGTNETYKNGAYDGPDGLTLISVNHNSITRAVLPDRFDQRLDTSTTPKAYKDDSPTGRTMITDDRSGSTDIWDTRTLLSRARIHLPVPQRDDPVVTDRYLVTRDPADGALIVREIDNPEPARTIPLPYKGTDDKPVLVSAVDDTTVAIIHDFGHLTFWDLATGRSGDDIDVRAMVAAPTGSLTFGPLRPGELFVYGPDRPDIEVWNHTTRRRVEALHVGLGAGTGTGRAPSRSLFVVSREKLTGMEIWDEGRRLATFPVKKIGTGGGYGLDEKNGTVTIAGDSILRRYRLGDGAVDLSLDLGSSESFTMVTASRLLVSRGDRIFPIPTDTRSSIAALCALAQRDVGPRERAAAPKGVAVKAACPTHRQ